MTHETETIFKHRLRFNLKELQYAHDNQSISVEVDEGFGFNKVQCPAGHVRACVRTFGVKEIKNEEARPTP